MATKKKANKKTTVEKEGKARKLPNAKAGYSLPLFTEEAGGAYRLVFQYEHMGYQVTEKMTFVNEDTPSDAMQNRDEWFLTLQLWGMSVMRDAAKRIDDATRVNVELREKVVELEAALLKATKKTK